MEHSSGVVVATFTTRDAADAAIRDLHHAGVRRAWLGVTQATQAGGERVAPLEPPAAKWFRSDDPENDETLYDALREHGVAEDDAHRIDGTVRDGNCVLVVEDARDARAATEIVQRHGGDALVAQSDPIGESAREEAAQRHPAQHVPTFKEELFVRRPRTRGEPAPY